MSEPVVYIAIRRDLRMRRGKEIAQAAHAVLGLRAPADAPVITVKAASLEHLHLLLSEADKRRVARHVVHDAGRTEVQAGEETCAVFGPVTRDMVPLLAEAELY